MQQTLKNTTLNDEDIKFLKRQLKKGYLTWIIFSLFSIVSPGVCIYMIITNEEISNELRGTKTLNIDETNCYDNSDIKVVFSENGFAFISKF